MNTPPFLAWAVLPSCVRLGELLSLSSAVNLVTALELSAGLVPVSLVLVLSEDVEGRGTRLTPVPVPEPCRSRAAPPGPGQSGSYLQSMRRITTTAEMVMAVSSISITASTITVPLSSEDLEPPLQNTKTTSCCNKVRCSEY
ncbi:hypothetical protein C0J52_26385 [Blattella germanica]|nr:hypothetical protein C0J52_26385 [Blattella germanica]